MKTRKEKRLARRYRIRSKVVGTSVRPRLAVFRSNRSMYAQVIDDTKGVTVCQSVMKDVTVAKAKEFGTVLAQELVKKGIKEVVYDRGGFRYHGVVKEFADAVRAGGITV